MSHFTTDDAARWVAGLLETPESEALAAHARTCPGCEALLQREARVELQLEHALATATAPAAKVVPLRSRGRLAWLAAPLALAAALALLIDRGPVEAARTAPDAGVAADEIADNTHFAGEAPPPEAFEARAPFSL